MSNEDVMRLVDGAGQPIGKPVKMGVDTGGVFEDMKDMPRDPVEVLRSRTRNQRDSMIGSLMGAYMRMTEFDPCEVEMVMREAEDGSVAFRFRPRNLEECPQLWAILAVHQEPGEPPMFGVVRLLAPGVIEEAAHAIARQIQDQIHDQGKTATVYAERVSFAGFPEDLTGEENGADPFERCEAGQEILPEAENAQLPDPEMAAPVAHERDERERGDEAEDPCCGGSCRPCESPRKGTNIDPDPAPPSDEEQAGS